MTKVEFYCACDRLARYVMDIRPQRMNVNIDYSYYKIFADGENMDRWEYYHVHDTESAFNQKELISLSEMVVCGKIKLNENQQYNKYDFVVLNPRVMFLVQSDSAYFPKQTKQDRLDRLELAMKFLIEEPFNSNNNGDE